jgi:hypothetical protein
MGTLLLKNRLPLRIHCWGGFGSQLNALCFALELAQRNPTRNLVLVFHTGGVTRRQVEIQELIPEFISSETIDDYVDKIFFRKKVNLARKLVSKILFFSRVIVSPSCNRDFSKIKPWTLSSRGHYSYMRFSHTVLDELANFLALGRASAVAAPLVLHYRLGDLLKLEKAFSKSHEILSVAKDFNPGRWLVLSDSTKEAFDLLSGNNFGVEFNGFMNLEPIQVMQIGFSSDVFIGTTSKLSIWVAVFRLIAGRGLTFLPKAMQFELGEILSAGQNTGLRFF